MCALSVESARDLRAGAEGGDAEGGKESRGRAGCHYERVLDSGGSLRRKSSRKHAVSRK